MALNAQRSSAAILQFMRTKRRYYIPSAIKLFHAKAVAQLLYGSQLGPFPNIATLERVQSKFLRAILGVPRNVANVKLRLETGQIKARIWSAILMYWLRLSYLPIGLAQLILQDTFKSKWVQLIEQKIVSLGLSRLTLLTMGME